MSDVQFTAAECIRTNQAVLGVEFGSTRIKASLISPDGAQLASGAHAWESQLQGGVWTYELGEIWRGLAACYASLVNDVAARYSVRLRSVAALGFSGMMHGYVALDREGELLVPFRTWRNNITSRACGVLGPVLDFAVPERWSIAHLYQSILEQQPHVPAIARLTTLAGYVHCTLSGRHEMGVGEASGMFPIDPDRCDWDAARLAKFDDLIAPCRTGWTLREILPNVVRAGEPAGYLSAQGAKLIDPTGELAAGIALCPPEGDAGTGMVATNSVRPRSGNVSAGTSVFAMIVLDRSLSRAHEHVDIVATPEGKPVAMAHCNNGLSDLDAWFALFGQAAQALGAQTSVDELYRTLLPLALRGNPDAGGLLSINYVSGEHMTGFTEGRPLFVRNHDSTFNLENFIRALYFATLCSLRTGVNILTQDEGVVIEQLRGHGGFFKAGDTGQRMLAAALNLPISVSAGAGEGGAWGMALLAAYLLRAERKQSLADYLDERIGKSSGRAVQPNPSDVKGFAEFFERHRRGLAIEREAVNSLQPRNAF